MHADTNDLSKKEFNHKMHKIHKKSNSRGYVRLLDVTEIGFASDLCVFRDLCVSLSILRLLCVMWLSFF